MLKKRGDRVRHWERRSREDNVELEGQFIMRIPKELADNVHEAINDGDVQERLTIKLDQDLRKGEVRLDDQVLYAKLLDLPTMMESYKTIDNKSFYKSADISQILVCKEDPDDEPEVEVPIKPKKKDSFKVDKKYLYPHGITPPCKNVRKRRFRKTLKKKNVEAPEIEKELKHLLRMDSEAIRVDYELINDGDDSDLSYKDSDDDSLDEATMLALRKAIMEKTSQRAIKSESSSDDEMSNSPTHRASNKRVAAHDIFGGELSTTDDDDEDDRPDPASTAGERMEEEDYSRMFDFFGSPSGSNKKPSSPKPSSSGLSFFDSSVLTQFQNMEFMNDPQEEYTQEQVQEKIIELQQQISDLKAQQSQKSAEIASMQNATLKRRMEKALENLYTQGIERELELKDFENMLD